MDKAVVQRLERRSISLNTEVLSKPVEIDRSIFKQSTDDRKTLRFLKDKWKALLPPGYKPQLVATA